MNNKFIVKPGEVISKNDGERHHVSFDQLVNLYDVRRSDCFDSTNMRVNLNNNSIILRPSYDGEYSLAETVHSQINQIVYVAEYKAEEQTKESFNSMSIIDRLWLAIKGYEL